jgi:hypothetical protein
MSEKESIHFTARVTNCDWEMMKDFITTDYPSKMNFNTGGKTWAMHERFIGLEKRWLTNEIKVLCTQLIIPYLAVIEDKERICVKDKPPQFHIDDKEIDGRKSIELLKEFARHKGKTVADIIQAYVIDKHLIKVEEKTFTLLQ